MGGARQWSVGFVDEKPQPYCRLLWDSEIGKTVEFRESKTEILWLVAKSTWSIPAGTKTKISLIGRRNTEVVPAAFFDHNTLRLLPGPEKAAATQIKMIIKQSFSGMPDLDMQFAGTEGLWTVPLSRVQELYATYDACLRRLITADQTTDATGQPF